MITMWKWWKRDASRLHGCVLIKVENSPQCGITSWCTSKERKYNNLPSLSYKPRDLISCTRFTLTTYTGYLNQYTLTGRGPDMWEDAMFLDTMFVVVPNQLWSIDIFLCNQLFETF